MSGPLRAIFETPVLVVGVVRVGNVPGRRVAGYQADGTADDVQIQAAIDGLTAGRTWVERIKLVGSFTIADTVLIDAYTYIDATEATFTAGYRLNKDMFRNRNNQGATGTTNDSYITWEGGILDGNRANQTAGGNDPVTNDPYCNLRLGRVPYVKVLNLTTKSSAGHNFKLVGRASGGETTEMHTVDGVYSTDSYARGITIQNGLRNGTYRNLNSINDAVNAGADNCGVFIGHSEGTYSDIFVDQSSANGLRIYNVRNIQMSNVQVKASARHNIHLVGLVASNMIGVRAARASVGNSNQFSDLYFDDDDSQGYGTTKQSIIIGQFGEDIAGQGVAKAAIEWKDTGADNAGVTMTSNESIVIIGQVSKGGGSSTVLTLPARTRRGTIQLLLEERAAARPTVPGGGTRIYGSQIVETDTQNNSNDLNSADQDIRVGAGAAPRTKKLPPAATAGPGKIITVWKDEGSGNNVTVSVTSGEYLNSTLNGTAAITIQRGFVTVMSDGVDNWRILAQKLT